MRANASRRVTAAVWCVAVCLCVSPCLGAQAKTGRRSRVAATRTAQGESPAGDVTVVVNESFLNAILDAVLSQPAPLKFPLGGGSGRCANEITLVRQAGGVRTAVRFAGARVSSVVAFRGTYETSLLGCLNFEGWADSTLGLDFDRERQALVGRVAVNQINLSNIPSLLTGNVTGLVQDAIDKRVNPVEILRTEQLGARLPLAQGDGPRLRAREVRHEVVGKELRLRIVYDIVDR